jgi:hypothetical protein
MMRKPLLRGVFVALGLGRCGPNVAQTFTSARIEESTAVASTKKSSSQAAQRERLRKGVGLG